MRHVRYKILPHPLHLSDFPGHIVNAPRECSQFVSTVYFQFNLEVAFGQPLSRIRHCLERLHHVPAGNENTQASEREHEKQDGKEQTDERGFVLGRALHK
ncbi:hypothetical protein D3C73_1107160 [compost metagenome]